MSIENNDLEIASRINSKYEADRTDEVDPRVQIELERLNVATDEINKLEVELDEARADFRHLLSESTLTLEAIAKRIGSHVEKVRPYYEARIKSKESLLEAQKAAVRFERANSSHAAAKEMVYLAEEGLTAEGRTFDHAWQEMLNHATMRVNESETERTVSESLHKRASNLYHATEAIVQRLEKDLKRNISKSRPYFEAKAHFNKLLEFQKTKVKTLENQLTDTKNSYADALRNLEFISDEIHQLRQTIVKERTGSLKSSSNQDSDEWSETSASGDSDVINNGEKLPASSSTLYLSADSDVRSSYRKLESKSTESSLCDEELGGTANKKIHSEPAILDINSAENVRPLTFPNLPLSDFLPKVFDRGNKVPEPPLRQSSGEDGEWSEICLEPDGESKEAPEASNKSSVGSSKLSSWISSRTSSLSNDQSNRKQSIDTIATGVKDMFSQGIMKLNISSLSSSGNERRGSEPKITQLFCKRPTPFSFDKTLAYLTPDDDSASSDSESLTSVEMLSDEQISSLMLDQEIQQSYQEMLAASEDNISAKNLK